MVENNLGTAAAATVSAPPLLRLPQEVLLAICGFGASTVIERDITSRLSRTCRALRDRLIPVLYRDIHSTRPRYYGITKLGILCRAVAFSPNASSLAGMIRSLDIHDSDSEMPDLESLTKLDAYIQDLLGPGVRDRMLTYVAGNDNLLVCILAHATNLARVKLIGRYWVIWNFEFLLRRHQRTRRNLGGRVSFPQVTDLHIGSEFEPRLEQKFCCNKYDGLFWCLPNLTTLHVSNAAGFASITARFPALATLKLSECDITPGGLDRFLRYAPALRRFEWRYSYTSHDKHINVSKIIDRLSKHHAATLEELLLSFTARGLRDRYYHGGDPGDRAKIPDDVGTKLTGMKHLSVKHPNVHICSELSPQAARNDDNSGPGNVNGNANTPDHPRHHDPSELVNLYRRFEPTLESLYISGINTRTFPSTIVANLLDTIVKEAKEKMERPKLSKIWLRAGDGGEGSMTTLNGDGERDEWQAFIEDVQARHGQTFSELGMDVRLDFWDTGPHRTG